jgi:hypothetical protein
MIYCMMTGMSGSGSKNETKQPDKLPVFTADLFSPELPPTSKRNPFYLPGEDPSGIEQTVASGNKASETKPAKTNAVKDPFSELVLNATYLMGEQRLAIINGQIYKQKDTLKPQNPSTPPFVIKQILPYEVLLECKGKIQHLRYSDVYAGTELKKSMKPSVANADGDSKREPKSKPAAPKSRSANNVKP